MNKEDMLLQPVCYEAGQIRETIPETGQVVINSNLTACVSRLSGSVFVVPSSLYGAIAEQLYTDYKVILESIKMPDGSYALLRKPDNGPFCPLWFDPNLEGNVLVWSDEFERVFTVKLGTLFQIKSRDELAELVRGAEHAA